MINLRKKFFSEIILLLQKKMNLTNPMAVPKLRSITLNMTGKNVTRDKEKLNMILQDLELISGQKPKLCIAKKSVSQWKVRKGFKMGGKVTLHRDMMYDFVERFISLIAPRILDFRGFEAKSFDGRGNFNIGIKDHSCFPEISRDSITRSQGLDIAINTNAGNDHNGYILLSSLGFPFKAKRI